ncbi:MAG TPA: CpsD/CapB family tyrosine-protein kinase [Terriglobales bacterium]|jgi:capsular exopolysaccharide synthesis family protein
MSRIYDALRQAEEEKQFAGELPAQSAQSDAFAPAAALPLADAAPVTTVTPATWHPVMGKLPTLTAMEVGAEEFRRLRSRLYQARDQQPFKSVLVTSGLPGEGKSFVAANLAVTLARHRSRRVLLIDGDLRKPALHSVLGTHNSPGLSEFLAGTAHLDQIIQTGSIPNLAFIPAGHESQNAAELVGNNHLEGLLARVQDSFDWIVIDSSPVVPVPDAISLARACETVLFVARAAATPYDVAQRLQREFKDSRVLGFVINAINDGNAKIRTRYAHQYEGPEASLALAAGAD